MTKKEFQTLRGQYRRVCRELYQRAESRAHDEFVLSDATIALYAGLRENVAAFAVRVGCSISAAADMLNLH